MTMQTENGLSFLSRVGAKPISDFAKDLFAFPLNPPEFIEISGDPGVGKSLLCMDLMATALLPKTIFNVSLDGLETGVIFIDSDQHFSILHFTDLLERKIKKKCLERRKELKQKDEDQSENEILFISKKDFNLKIQNTIKNCLKNLYYLNCSNSNQFSVTLLSLGQILTTKTNISLVFIDSISAYYWYDRIYKTSSWHKMELYLTNILHMFINIIKKNYLICITTKQNLFKKQELDTYGNVSECPNFVELGTYDFLGKEWNNTLSVKINMKHDTAERYISSDNTNKDLCYVVEILREGASITKTLYCTFHDDGLHWLSKHS